MSYERQAAVPSGQSRAGRDEDDQARKGSVRAARERLDAAQRHQVPGASSEQKRIVGLPARPNQLVSQFSVQNARSRPQQMPTPPSSSESVGATVSPTPQWPLPNDTEDVVLSSVPQSQPRTADRGPPPQRPPRPSYVPSILNHPKPTDLPIQQPPPAITTQEATYRDEDFLSPTYGTNSSGSGSRPLTTSSASTGSSLGSIPDFPVPAQPLPRRSPNIGPPPSARRGPSSYYSQTSYVSPIAEEAEINRSHHGSFASSNVIPINAHEFYFDEDASPSDDDRPISIENGRESRVGDHDEQSGLVRQASVGRRTRPSLTTIKSGDSLRAEDRATSKRKAEKKQGLVAQAAISAGATGGAFAAGMGVMREQQLSRNSSRGSGGLGNGSLSSGTGLLDPSSSSSSESLDSFNGTKSKPKGDLKPKVTQTRSRSPLAPLDSKPAHGLRDFEKEGFDSPTHPLQMPTRQTSLADRVGKRRPPRLNVDAVKEAEARGSLTSLPDLIRSATRLAANLDRGRTASRLGMDFFDTSNLEKKEGDIRSSGSLSDILASFPPPGLATPTGDYSPRNRRMSGWPSGLAMAETASMGDTGPSKPDRRRRRCCGMPLWAFVLLLIVLLLLIAAAVVIPIVLIVLPRIRDKNAASSPGATSQASQCAASITCENGGVAIVNPDASCSCLCTNGFTGTTCSSGSDEGCVTQDVDGIKSATLGIALPRLLEDAQANFSIPLNSSLILSLFSSTNLSCTSENALVTFNGLSSRSIDVNLPLLDTFSPSSALSASIPTITLHTEPRHLEARQDVATTNGLVIQASPTSAPAPTGTNRSSPTPSSTVSTASNGTALDFARVGVLLILQESRKMDTAVAAQENLQTFFEGRSNDASNVGLGSNFSIDLINLTISLSNGTVVGSGAAGNATKTR